MKNQVKSRFVLLVCLLVVLTVPASEPPVYGASLDTCVWACYENSKRCRTYCAREGYISYECGESCNQGSDWCMDQCVLMYI